MLPSGCHVLRLSFLRLDQLTLDLSGRTPKILAQGFLPLSFRLTLFDRRDETLQMMGERFDT
jgi:hypothetical protein